MYDDGLLMFQPKQMCLSVDLQEVVKVENRKPAAARVIAYYQPSKYSSIHDILPA